MERGMVSDRYSFKYEYGGTTLMPPRKEIANMRSLLLQSCSASKQEVNDPIPAYDLYTGYYYRILKKAEREGQLRDDLDLIILSGEHGILEPNDRISTYDKQMTADRAEELNDSVLAALRDCVQTGTYERMVLNMGETYTKAVAGLHKSVDMPVGEITGGGLGEKGNSLYKFVRGDDSVVNYQVVV